MLRWFRLMDQPQNAFDRVIQWVELSVLIHIEIAGVCFAELGFHFVEFSSVSPLNKGCSISMSTPEALFLERQRMKSEGSLQIWMVGSDGLEIPISSM